MGHTPPSYDSILSRLTAFVNGKIEDGGSSVKRALVGDDVLGVPKKEKTPPEHRWWQIVYRMLENFAYGECFYALPITSKLDALFGANASFRTSHGALGAERSSHGSQ